jgi:gamma-butyrobetaine dioxygenase
LAPGDVLIMDNRRLLHGRAGFSTADTNRHLQGAYADADGLYSTLFRLTDRRVAAELTGLADLFASAAMAEPYGEEVSIRNHMLQTAELAVQRRLGGAMVTSALLHDVGWAMGEAAHEHASADLVEPLFGAAIAEPIRQHVAAKRYLVGTRPEYHDVLSEASRHTLEKQGGPMTPPECLAFAATPACAAALDLRSLDDAGKDLRGAATSFADYAPLLRRQMIRHLLT